jgi:hypothetical protein
MDRIPRVACLSSGPNTGSLQLGCSAKNTRSGQTLCTCWRFWCDPSCTQKMSFTVARGSGIREETNYPAAHNAFHSLAIVHGQVVLYSEHRLSACACAVMRASCFSLPSRCLMCRQGSERKWPWHTTELTTTILWKAKLLHCVECGTFS